MIKSFLHDRAIDQIKYMWGAGLAVEFEENFDS
jgi:hypothetical protein